MGSSLGRFMSPDPKVPTLKHLVNPQKWNKYSYVLDNPLAFFDPSGWEEVTIQVRAFISQGSVAGFKGDNRSFSTDPKASSRVSVTVKIETDPAKNHGNPFVGTPEVVIGPTHPVTGGEKTADGPHLPVLTASQDKKTGDVTVTFQEEVRNPYVPVGQGISTNLSVTVDQNATHAEVQGTVSGSPSFETNFTVDGGTTENLPLQPNSQNPLFFGADLQGTNSVDKKIDLPPPNKKDPDQ